MIFTSEHLLKMKEGLILFNQEKFWECHEALEDIWKEDAHDPARYIYWAVIQIAATLIHYRDKKIEGAKGMIFKTKEKLKKIEELNLESDLINMKLNWQSLKKIVRDIPEKPELSDFEKLFNFKFELGFYDQ